MEKLKKQIVIFLIFCLGIVCVGCNNTNQLNNEEDKEKENISYDEYFAQIVDENIKGLDCTILLMDLKSGEVLGNYGNVNKNFEPGDILKPVVYASLIENDISLEDSVDVSVAEYNGEYYRSKENFEKGETKTILESMELLNNPAIINIWKDFDKKEKVLYDLSSIGVMLDDDLAPLIGYKTIVSGKDIAQVYRAFANSEQQSDEPFTISLETKLVINDILKKAFENVCEYGIENYTPYGVFETISYTENENDIMNSNASFAGYLKSKTENEEGVVLVVNVTASEQEHTIENLKKIVSDIFVDYILRQ